MRLLILIFLLTITLLPQTARGGDDVLVITEINPPLNFVGHGELTGIATDILMEMEAIAGLGIKRERIEVWPWARGYEEALHRPNTILFSTARTPQREKFFHWVGPIITLNCSMVAPKTNEIKTSCLVDASKRLKIGTIRESAPEQEIIAAGASPERLQRVHDLKLNVKKLVEGRIDTILFNEPAVFHTIKQMGYDPNDYEVVFVNSSMDLYFAVSKMSEPDMVKRLQAAIATLRKNGTVDRIMADYIK